MESTRSRQVRPMPQYRQALAEMNSSLAGVNVRAMRALTGSLAPAAASTLLTPTFYLATQHIHPAQLLAALCAAAGDCYIVSAGVVETGADGFMRVVEEHSAVESARKVGVVHPIPGKHTPVPGSLLLLHRPGPQTSTFYAQPAHRSLSSLAPAGHEVCAGHAGCSQPCAHATQRRTSFHPDR